MNESDAIQAMYAVRDVAANDAMNFITLVSAYLVVAYFVGAKLTAFQFRAISCLYSVWVVAPIMALYVAASDIHVLGGPQIHPMFRYPLLLPIIMAASWAVSIVFMIQIRKDQKQENKDKVGT